MHVGEAFFTRFELPVEHLLVERLGRLLVARKQFEHHRRVAVDLHPACFARACPAPARSPSREACLPREKRDRGVRLAAHLHEVRAMAFDEIGKNRPAHMLLESLWRGIFFVEQQQLSIGRRKRLEAIVRGIGAMDEVGERARLFRLDPRDDIVADRIQHRILAPGPDVPARGKRQGCCSHHELSRIVPTLAPLATGRAPLPDAQPLYSPVRAPPRWAPASFAKSGRFSAVAAAGGGGSAVPSCVAHTPPSSQRYSSER